ncbi:MAG: hypothetical protein M3Q49_06620 [Actinomycetota bacterium]|nr:hypothetical protein [Actinomycetota bacterium]
MRTPTPSRAAWTRPSLGNARACETPPPPSALAERVAKLDAKRERLLDLAADGILGKADLTARLSGVDAERRGFERELARVFGAAERVAEMERQKRLLVEAFGTGLKLGVA